MTPTAPAYPKGDLRRLLAVVAAIDALGANATLVRISALSGVDKKTVTSLIAAAVTQAGMTITKAGPTYTIESWGPVIAKKGATLALTGALNAPIMNP
jgi:hypothetical protein